jgi:hypothetical protein
MMKMTPTAMWEHIAQHALTVDDVESVLTKPTIRVLSEPLKNAILQSAMPIDELATAATVSPTILTRFVAGEGDLRLATADRLAKILGLRVVWN